MRRTQLTVLIIFFLSALCHLSQGKPRIKTFLPQEDKANGAAVIICPGGSYYWLSRKVEGRDVAKALADKGFAAFLLYYRHAGTRYFLFKDLAFPQSHYPDALDDLRETIAEIRKNAQGNGIDPDRIGVMGFSAGGHLALNSGKDVSCIDGVDTRPDYIASIYPVITMSDETIVHKRSRTALLGKRKNDPVMRDSLSLEKHIPQDMPPVFLVNCKDDPTVDYRNSEVMAASLKEADIEVEYHQYERGGHGFGTSSDTAPWLDRFVRWFDKLFGE